MRVRASWEVAPQYCEHDATFTKYMALYNSTGSGSEVKPSNRAGALAQCCDSGTAQSKALYTPPTPPAWHNLFVSSSFRGCKLPRRACLKHNAEQSRACKAQQMLTCSGLGPHRVPGVMACRAVLLEGPQRPAAPSELCTPRARFAFHSRPWACIHCGHFNCQSIKACIRCVSRSGTLRVPLFRNEFWVLPGLARQTPAAMSHTPCSNTTSNHHTSII